MLTCVLNASEGQLNIVLGTVDGILCSQSWATSAKGPIKGAEILTPALDALFSISPFKINDVERWACVHGPGSFTGIRLVLGTVAGIRRITKAQNASIDFLQALAFDAHNICEQMLKADVQKVWTLSHARRDMVHCQTFSLNKNDLPKPLNTARLAMIDEVIKELSNEDKPLVIGSGYAKNKDWFDSHLPKDTTVIEHVNPSSEALWQLALKANYHTNDLEPLYTRPCDAVENLDSIAKKQGMEPAFAHARLEELLKQNNF